MDWQRVDWEEVTWRLSCRLDGLLRLYTATGVGKELQRLAEASITSPQEQAKELMERLPTLGNYCTEEQLAEAMKDLFLSLPLKPM